jgi:spore coat polysaccharide biosynthesis protein SpsF
MNVGIILQARMGSSRLPGKVLEDIRGISLLNRCFETMKRSSKNGEKIYLATTELEEDRILLSESQKSNVIGYGGHPSDLIHRFSSIATSEKLGMICRMTCDNPFIDYKFIQYSIKILRKFDSEVPTIVTSRCGSLAPGLDVETFNIAALRKAELTSDDFDREHVTSGMVETQGYRVIGLNGKQIDEQYSRLTVDLATDLEVARRYAVKFDIDHRSVTNFEQRNN